MKASKVINLVSELSAKNPMIKDRVEYFSITEIFVINGDLGITSIYNVPVEVVEMIEKEVCGQ